LIASEKLIWEMDPEEAVKKAAGEQGSGGNGGGDPLITKSELRDELRSWIQGLMEMNLIGPREVRELKL
jgi:hypothetical protein